MTIMMSATTKPVPCVEVADGLGARILFGDSAHAIGAGVEIDHVIATLFTHHILTAPSADFFVSRHSQIEALLPGVFTGELRMPETGKAKAEKPETRSTVDGYITPTPPKRKVVEPVVSRASHFS
jgi:hypothetical protein